MEKIYDLQNYERLISKLGRYKNLKNISSRINDKKVKKIDNLLDLKIYNGLGKIHKVISNLSRITNHKGGGKSEELKNKVEDLSKTVDAFMKELNIDKIIKSVQNMKKNLSDTEKNMEQMKKERDECLNDKTSHVKKLVKKHEDEIKKQTQR